MTDDIKNELGKWFSNCDPLVPLELSKKLDNERYVPLDAWPDAADGGKPTLLRGHDIVSDLIREIELRHYQSPPESTQLFAGFRGTGKSTELSRLAQNLSDRYTVLRFKADDYHHMSSALRIEELALILAAGIGEQAKACLGVELLSGKSIWTRISDFLNREVEVQDLSLKFGDIGMKARLKQGQDFRDELQKVLATRPDSLKNFLHEFVMKVAAGIKPRELVILVDGLDKFYAPTENVGEVYRALSNLFFHHSDLLRLPDCHVVYTIPPYLAFINQGIADKFGGKLHTLPSVKTHAAPPDTDVSFAPGVSAMEAVLDHRVDLDRLFGDQRGACVALLVAASGGQTRDLCNLAREVIRIAFDGELPVGTDEVRLAIRAIEQSRGTFFKEVREILATIHDTGRLESLSETQLGALAGAMDQQLVLCYCNGESWYDVHPMILKRVASNHSDAGCEK